MELWHEPKGSLDSEQGAEEGLGNALLKGLRRRWLAFEFTIMSGETNDQVDGVVGTAHSGMHQVTGVSMLTCSFRCY